MEVVKKYAKAFMGALGLVLSVFLASVVGDGVIQASEYANMVILGAGAAGVAIAPNVPGSKYVKLGLSALAAAATVLVSVYTGGISPAEWAQIGIAVATALGIYQVPNKGDFLDRNFNANVALQ